MALQMEEKCWGRVAHVFVSPRAAVSYLEVKEGFCCSKHRHQERANDFIVISGMLLIEEFNATGDQIKSTLLCGCDSCKYGNDYSVPSGVWHRFVVLRSGQVIEVYWPDNHGTVRINDIERKDEGGRVFVPTVPKPKQEPQIIPCLPL